MPLSADRLLSGKLPPSIVVKDTNWLSDNDASFETDVSGYYAGTANASFAQSGAQFEDGSYSLAMTSVSSSGVDVAVQKNFAPGSGNPLVVPGMTYTVRADFRAAVTPRTCNVSIQWLDKDGGYLGGSYGGDYHTSSTSGWTQCKTTDIAPAGAVYAQVQLVVTGTTAAGETHYVDRVGFYNGTDPSWARTVALSGLNDAFDAVSLNTNKWTLTNDTGSTGTINSGRFRVTPPLAASGLAGYSKIVSNSSYRLVGSSVSVRAYPLGSGWAGSAETHLTVYQTSGTDDLFVWCDGTTLFWRMRTGGSTILSGSTSYNSTNHAFWRMRESEGTIYIEASTDTKVWTFLASVATPTWASSVVVRLMAGHYTGGGVDGSPAIGEFDNLNLPPANTSVAISGTGTFAATGKPTQKASAAISGSGAIAATGARVRSGSASLSGTGTLAASGIKIKTGSASLSGSGVIAASSVSTRKAAASVAGIGSIAATGTRTRSGAVSLAGTGTVAASGVYTRVGRPAVSGTGAVAATGSAPVRPAFWSTIVDLMNGPSHSAIWNGPRQNATLAAGRVEYLSGALRLTPSVGPSSYTMQSAPYRVDSPVIFEVPSVLSGLASGSVTFGLAMNYWFFTGAAYVTLPASGTTASLIVTSSSGSALKTVNLPSYSTTTHRYWRFRISGAQVLIDSSPDLMTWTNRLTTTVTPDWVTNDEAPRAFFEVANSNTFDATKFGEFGGLNPPIQASASISGSGSIAATGKRIVGGSAAISGTGAIAASGQRQRLGTSAVAGAGVLSASAKATRKAAAAVAGTGAVAASAKLTRNASVAVSGHGTIAAAGSYVRVGVPTVHGQGTIAATAIKTSRAAASAAGLGIINATAVRGRNGQGSVSGIEAVAATARSTRYASAAIAGTGLTVAVGSRNVRASASVVGSGSVASSGRTTHIGAPAVHGSGSVSASGMYTRCGVVTSSGTGSISASGRRTGVGRAALAGQSTLTATGKHTGVGSSSVAGSGSMIAAGIRQVTVAGSIMAQGSLTATGRSSRLAAVSVSGAGTVASSAQRTSYQSISVSASSAMLAAAVHTGIGATALSGSSALSATSQLTRVAQLSLSGSGSIASGSIRIPVGRAILTFHSNITGDGDRYGISGPVSMTSYLSMTAVGQYTAVALAYSSGLGELDARGYGFPAVDGLPDANVRVTALRRPRTLILAREGNTLIAVQPVRLLIKQQVTTFIVKIGD